MSHTPHQSTPGTASLHAAGLPDAHRRLQSIEQARQVALHERAALPAGWIAPWIERSWQRCIHQGLQPGQMQAFEAVGVSHQRHTLEANQHLRHTAQPVLESLGHAIVNTRYFAILTNAAGVVVDVSGPIDRSDPRADLITRIGTDLSEASMGTTAIGAALAELQPVWLHRGEHFFSANGHYTCAGAPLFGPDGACVGMLDLTGIDALERPELKHLVTQSASKIENALVLAQAHSLMVRLNWPGYSLGSEADGIVCLDADGWVTGANPIARQMVAGLATVHTQVVHVSELFGVPYQFLFDAARPASLPIDIPLWTGLRLQALPVERAYETQPVHATQARTAVRLPLKDVEAALIRKAVEQARGNVAEAARILGISRATVYRKLGQRPSPTD
ncbi:MAG: helix-turn-helix domain-containing protein [Rhodoferax sp.]|nr:helix-turn-helix domain-containing protein [Rhodoferax sp.]